MPNYLKLEPPQKDAPTRRWFEKVFKRLSDNPFGIRGYTVASLPTASEWASTTSSDIYSSVVFVSDEVGGATLAFSDGTNWRRVQDRAIVS